MKLYLLVGLIVVWMAFCHLENLGYGTTLHELVVMGLIFLAGIRFFKYGLKKFGNYI